MYAVVWPELPYGENSPGGLFILVITINRVSQNYTIRQSVHKEAHAQPNNWAVQARAYSIGKSGEIGYTSVEFTNGRSRRRIELNADPRYARSVDIACP